MKDKKCLHATCTCPALPLQDYCGNECKTAAGREEAGDEPMSRCECHHPDCGGELEIPIEAESLLMASQALAPS